MVLWPYHNYHLIPKILKKSVDNLSVKSSPSFSSLFLSDVLFSSQIFYNTSYKENKIYLEHSFIKTNTLPLSCKEENFCKFAGKYLPILSAIFLVSPAIRSMSVSQYISMVLLLPWQLCSESSLLVPTSPLIQ